MASVLVLTNGHEAVDEITFTPSAIWDSWLTDGHIVAVAHNTAPGTAELVAALQLCRAAILQREG